MLAASAVALTARPAGALETDQYLAWNVELLDSRHELNAFVNDEVAATLTRLNRGPRARAECEVLPPLLLKALFRTTSIPSRLRRFLKANPAIDRHPSTEVGYWSYLSDSLFRSPAFPFVMPMARTIRVGDVYTGTDKLGHVFGFGRRYYNRYRAGLARGLDEEEALRRVVRWGVAIERYLAGGVLDGVFSYADVEANYQGLRLALDMCGGDAPYLAPTARGWILARPVDLGRYVTPNFDESYYNSHFSEQRWKSIRSILEGYCPLYRSAGVRAARARYRELDHPSPSMRIVAEIFARRGIDRQSRHSIEAVCAPPTALQAQVR